jgi:hypothetical protein
MFDNIDEIWMFDDIDEIIYLGWLKISVYI